MSHTQAALHTQAELTMPMFGDFALPDFPVAVGISGEVVVSALWDRSVSAKEAGFESGATAAADCGKTVLMQHEGQSPLFEQLQPARKTATSMELR
ncbi:hypothetical protein LP417_35680 (plasmid) [Polaromonas sp. P1-6]|nr:hypothetical protein LP417_35680 [Polaromonas sp. P1-6]